MNKETLNELLKDAPFKTVFKATLAFYLAQTAMTLLGLITLLGIGLLIKWVLF